MIVDELKRRRCKITTSIRKAWLLTFSAVRQTKDFGVRNHGDEVMTRPQLGNRAADGFTVADLGRVCRVEEASEE